MLQPVKQSETILGYRLRERIGAGGYGEVWVAEAPGGLLKAVKLVFGYHDENRAQAELKSLNRIKEVRHPFLLSLERIDVVDGRLVVVTELAEKSLKDRFLECLEEGKPGIAREELLKYLADTADALDYLMDTHSLQHLDIKPENLLLVGGHVKVADFGLVKDIHDGTQSLMTGLTPTYAAPELFDGRPNRNSDQYSLAIVFQEMLTGGRPFDGKTAAQLAGQHLNGTPDLTGLPAADQRVIKRALAKSPEVRYGNCRSFVQELTQVKRTRPVRTRSINQEAMKAANGTMAMDSKSVGALPTKLVEQKLPPADFVQSDAVFQPTFFLGVGQTATGVLRFLRRRLRERLGDAADLPSLPVLCLDTDIKELDRATRQRNAADLRSLSYDEILPIPLRSAAEYRNQKDIDLNWLSRRWIYNIPRSRQTECLRPLGRLAFVDHHKEIFGRLESIVEGMTNPEAVEATATRVGLPGQRELARVFLVASISGGVGSGMVADLAYAVRTVLAEQGFAEAAIHGILLFSSGRTAARRDVTVANTYSCLSELNHFSFAEGYPGDPATGLPRFDEGPTFDETYLVNLGSDPLPDEYEAMADELAEYLYLNAATECGGYFDACRRADHCPDEKFVVRTIGLNHSGWVGGDVISLPANVLGNQLFSRWLKEPKDSSSYDVRHVVANAFERMQLSSTGFSQRLATLVAEKLGKSLDDIVCDDLKTVQAEAEAYAERYDAIGLRQLAESSIDRVLGLESNTTSGRFEARLKNILEVTVDRLVQTTADDFSTMVLGWLDSDGSRLWQAEQFREVCLERLEQLGFQIREHQRGLRNQISTAEQELGDRLRKARPKDGQTDGEPAFADGELAEWMKQYGLTRIHEFVGAFVKRAVDHLATRVEQMQQFLRDVHQIVQGLANDFEQRYSEEERIASIGAVGQRDIVATAFLKKVTTNLDDLAAQLDAKIQAEYFEPRGGLQKVVQERTNEWEAEVARMVYLLARQIVSHEVCQVELSETLSEHESDVQSVRRWATDSLALAIPHLLTTCGGGSRLIVAAPRGSTNDSISTLMTDGLTDHPQFFPVTHGDVVFCYEVGSIPASQVAAMLIHTCPQASELVPRVHSRTDIQWQPIIKL